MKNRPNVQEKFPQFWWDCIWENVSHSFLSLSTRSMLYLIFNDEIPNKTKMYIYTDTVDHNLCEIRHKLELYGIGLEI